MAESSISSTIPPKFMLKIANSIMPWMLQSGMHKNVSDFMLLLLFKGRKSGKQFQIPVSYQRLDGVINCFTASPWLKNLRSDPTLEIVLQGQRRPAKAEIVDDPAVVAQALRDTLVAIGPKNASRFAFKVTGDVPPVDQVQQALAGRSLLKLHLTD